MPESSSPNTRHPKARNGPGASASGIAGERLSGERGLVARVVAALGRAIIGGQIQPNQPLPTEAELGFEFGVSRTVVREAVRVLASKGLLEIRTRTGIRVRPADAWQRLDSAVLAWQGESPSRADFVRELFELRRMIEPQAAAFAARRIDASGLAELARAFEAMVRAGEDTEAFFAADRRFHFLLLRSVGNTLVLALSGVVEQALELSLRLSLSAPRGQQHATPLHKAVLQAIEAQDPEAASKAMRSVIDDAEADVAQSLAAKDAPANHGEPERSRIRTGRNTP